MSIILKGLLSPNYITQGFSSGSGSSSTDSATFYGGTALKAGQGLAPGMLANLTVGSPHSVTFYGGTRLEIGSDINPGMLGQLTIGDALAPFDDDLQTFLVSRGIKAAPWYIPQRLVVPQYLYCARNLEPVQEFGGETGLVKGDYQISAWSDSYRTSLRMILAVRKIMTGFRGMMGLTEVQGVVIDSVQNDTKPGPDGSSQGLYHCFMLLDIYYLDRTLDE